MPLSDYTGMSDRDILVAVAVRQESLANDLEKFTEAQTDCNKSIDERVRDLEMYGSKVSKDIAVSVMVIDKRLTKVERSCLVSDTETTSKKTWVDSIYTKLGIVSGILLGVLAFIIEVYWRIRGGIA